MIINHNMSSIFANRQLKITEGNLDKDISKLSSGMRINRAGDDASGLAVSEKMRSQIKGLHTAMRNTEDAISFLQTTEGYLDETTNILQRMRELSIQAGNGIYDSKDRSLIDVEMKQLIAEVDRIATQSQFNGIPLLNGALASPDPNKPAATGATATTPSASSDGLWFHIGANMDQRIHINVESMRAEALNLVSGTDNKVTASSAEAANQSIGVIDEALTKVMRQRTDLGAYQNRLEKLSKGLYVAFENMQAAESQIRDTNMASSMSEFVKDQILSQANVSMLAQANLKPQLVLRLLG